MCSPWLPGEVWTLVFRHLPLSDRLRLRATCKHFRDLVDSALWRNRTVVLHRRSGDEYEEDFWRMLRRWRVTSARLISGIKWVDLTKNLPGLTTLIIDRHYPTDIKTLDLRSLTNLERLHLHCGVRFEELSLILPQGLTHLTVYDMFHIDTTPLPPEIPPDSPFKKLKSLVFHYTFDPHPVNVLHFLLSSLPQLQHLSLSVFIFRNISFEGHISDLPPLHNCSLSSLELLNCDTKKFPLDFMKMLSKLSFLQTLSISCTPEDDDYDFHDESEKLSVWLKDLPTLSSLIVMCAQIGGFVGSIPSSVTRLTLMLDYVDSEDLTELSVQLPNLQHLYMEKLVPDDPEMEPDDPRLGPVSEVALIPRLFPRLKTLRLSIAQVSEDTLLSLASLKELEVLELEEVEWSVMEPLPTAAISKLRELTNYRVQIYKKHEGTCGWSPFYIPTV